MPDIFKVENFHSVSVIIPIYNGEQFIKEAIDSILEQTYPVSEIIVVNDGSDDKSLDIVSGYKNIVLVNKAHTGLNDTLNHGLQNATGDFIAFLDADDRWLPFKISKQIDILINSAHIDVVFGHAERFQSIRAGNDFHERVIDVLPGISLQGGLFTKSSFNKVGIFTDDPNKHGFIDWYARATELGIKMKIDDIIVFQRRIHEKNDGILNKDRQKKGYFNTLKAALDRRREKLK